MKQWSYQRSFENVGHWNDDPVYMSIPALHTCNLCYSEGKKFKGHDAAWCRIYRSPKNSKENEKEVKRRKWTCFQKLSLKWTKPSNAWYQEQQWQKTAASKRRCNTPADAPNRSCTNRSRRTSRGWPTRNSWQRRRRTSVRQRREPTTLERSHDEDFPQKTW